MAVQEARLQVAMGDLQKAQAQLDEKEAELAKVREMYDQAMREKQVGLCIMHTYTAVISRHLLLSVCMG